MAIIPNDPAPNADRTAFVDVVETTPYNEDYQEKCFVAWYQNGKPRGKKLQAVIPEDEFERKPEMHTIYKWQRQSWNERAKELDLKTRESLDDLIIRKRVEMFERHAEVGAQLADMGLDYLEDFAIGSDASAIRAIREGTDLERKSLGISELLKKLSTMSDDQLKKRFEELVAADEDENILDAEFEENDVEDASD